MILHEEKKQRIKTLKKLNKKSWTIELKQFANNFKVYIYFKRNW